MAGTTRKTRGAPWSATHAIVWYGPGGERLADADATRAVRAQVRWRYVGKEGKQTFSGPTCRTHARRLGALLAAARAHDWPADDRRQPVPQATDTTLPPAPVPTTLETRAPRLMGPRAVATDAAAGARAAAARATAAPTDVASLAAWYREHLKTGLKKKGGRRRSTKTLGGYLNTLDFIVEHLRYAPGDPRLAACGRDPGDSMVLHPEHGLCTADLLVLLDCRRATDLRTRAANERRMATWQGAVEKEARRASTQGRTPVLPPAPVLRCEEASARTIEEMARIARAMLEEAFGYGLVDYQPWTQAVSDHVPHPYAPAYCTKNVASTAEVWELARAMSSFARRSSDLDGRPVTVDGDRYAALVVLAGRHGPRPEESIALRHSWVTFEAQRIVVELQEAEVEVPKWLTGAARTRTTVPLKHRMPGTVRRFEVTDPEEMASMRHHFECYVPEPDPTSKDPDRRDPRVFTTHRGAPLDLGNFGEAWWKPVVARCFGESDKVHLRTLQFKELRAAAITSWLVEGCSLYRCAQKAGNSPGVIEKYYAGVLEDIGYDDNPGRGAGAVAAPDLGSMSEEDLQVLAKAVGVERHRRVDEELGERV